MIVANKSTQTVEQKVNNRSEVPNSCHAVPRPSGEQWAGTGSMIEAVCGDMCIVSQGVHRQAPNTVLGAYVIQLMQQQAALMQQQVMGRQARCTGQAFS